MTVSVTRRRLAASSVKKQSFCTYKLNTFMHCYLIFTADLNPWRAQRVFLACQALVSILDPGFETEPLDLDGVRVGWFFHTSTEEARRRLIVFFTSLVGRVADEQPYLDPAILTRYDAAAAYSRLAEVAR